MSQRHSECRSCSWNDVKSKTVYLINCYDSMSANKRFQIEHSCAYIVTTIECNLYSANTFYSIRSQKHFRQTRKFIILPLYRYSIYTKVQFIFLITRIYSNKTCSNMKVIAIKTNVLVYRWKNIDDKFKSVRTDKRLQIFRKHYTINSDGRLKN